MPQPLTLDARVVAGRDQMWANLAGESVILGMQDGVYYGLDAVATRIWELLGEPRVLSDIAATIAMEFDVSPGRAGEDLLAFATELRAHGLIDIVDP